MNTHFFNGNVRQNVRLLAWMLAALITLSTITQTLFAQTNADCSSVSGSWCLRISEKEKQLVHYDEAEWMKPLMWDIGITRNDYYRNMPTLELSNIAAVGSPDITQFQMTIGDTRFHFEDDFLGAAALLGESTLDEYDLTSSVSADGNLLTVKITEKGGTGGLAPGDLVRFRIDIDVDANFANQFYNHPDFRTVLFDKNGQQVYGNDPNAPAPSNDNAKVTVQFSNNTSIGPTSLSDFSVTGMQDLYYNGQYHPRGVMEGVDIFTLGGGSAIPEPATAVMALMAVCGVLSFRTRNRRN